MSEPQDRLAEIKGHRQLVYSDNVDPLHFVDIRIADLDWLVGECERLREEKKLLARLVPYLRGLLKRLEWEGTKCLADITGCEDEPACPACDGLQTEGHHPTCWLAAELSST